MNWSIFLAALIAVESSGDPAAIGDPPSPGYGAASNGRALGILQIHAEVIRDVNRIYGTHYRHSDALNPARAKKICKLYLQAYAGRNATPERMARIWNGGPNGHKKQATVQYWRRVETKLRGRVGR